MKRFVALLLVLVMACLCLASCSEDIRDSIKDHLGEYDYTPTVIEDITLDVYVVCDDYRETGVTTNDGTLESNKGVYDAVKRQINLHTTETYHTTLNIYYVPSADYEATVNENLDTADLILVTSKAMMDSLMAEERLADLTSFFSTNTYGALNVNIAQALLDAVKIDGKYYAVPNNRVLGTYTYVCINKQIVHNTMKYPLASIADYPFVFSLDMCKDESSMARLVRGLIAQSVVAGKDADAIKALQEELFSVVAMEEFNSTYGTSTDPTENINRAKALLAFLTEEERAQIQQSYDVPIDTLLVPPTAAVGSDDYNLQSGNIEAIRYAAEYYYKATYLNYGFVDPEDPSTADRKPYPVVSDLIAQYVATCETAEACELLLANDLFTVEEIQSILDYTESSMYSDVTMTDTFSAQDYSAYSVITLSGAAYEDRAAMEAAGWICNVVAAPTIDEEVAFESAFAVVEHEDVDTERVMQILYALNEDVYLHNMLLYGVETINYNLIDGVVELYGEDYRMDPKYVGNLFTSYYCEEIGLTKDVFENGALQNKDVTFVTSVIPEEPAPEEPAPEEANPAA